MILLKSSKHTKSHFAKGLHTLSNHYTKHGYKTRREYLKYVLSITHNPSANSTLNNSIKITVHMYFYLTWFLVRLLVCVCMCPLSSVSMRAVYAGVKKPKTNPDLLLHDCQTLHTLCPTTVTLALTRCISGVNVCE